MKLEIGSGKKKQNGFIGVDIIDYPTVDHILDLNKDVLPFQDNSVDEVFSAHCLEHLTPSGFLFCLDEMYRVSKPNIIWNIIVPYYNSMGTLANPYHTNNIFNEFTFYFFSKESGPEGYYAVVSKGTANEPTKTTVKVLDIQYLYTTDYRYLNERSKEEQRETRLKYCNVVLNISYKLQVVK
jgi:ubiquinone/menaquinone biosynthesis C-methylase UbiE